MTDNHEHPTLEELDQFIQNGNDEYIGEHIKSCPICEKEVSLLRRLEDELALPANESHSIPAEIDDAMSAFINQRSSEIKQKRFANRLNIPFKVAAGIAAVFIAGIFFSIKTDITSPSAASSNLVNGFEDANSDGEINILDAYLLAKNNTNDAADNENVQQLIDYCVAVQ